MKVASKFNAEALLAAQQAKRIGLTQQQISLAIGASQSQVSRVLSGQSRRRSRLLDEVCKYVNTVVIDGKGEPDQSHVLMDALRDVWDGTPQHARALALVIRSLGELTASAVHRTSQRR